MPLSIFIFEQRYLLLRWLSVASDDDVHIDTKNIQIFVKYNYNFLLFIYLVFGKIDNTFFIIGSYT